MTGQKYGMLTVKRQAKHRKDSDLRWLCECECGNEVIVRGCALRSGQITNCGCLSAGEEAVHHVLQDKSIAHDLEYVVSYPEEKSNRYLRFDFAIKDKRKNIFFIEYQGEQHFVDLGEFGKQQREETDQLKRDYCKEHNIPLYEIRYDEDIENRIDEILADIHYFDDKPQPAASARLV